MRFPFVLLSALVCLFVAAPTTAGRPMTAEDLWAMDRVGGPLLSPDGEWVVFTVTTYDTEADKGNSDLWLVPADGHAAPRRLTWNPGADSNPVWSPDGRRIAFLSKRNEEAPAQLYVLPLRAGGEAEPVTELPVAPQDPRWFPDGRRIAFLATTWPDLDDDWEALKERVKERKEDKTQAKVTDTRLVRYWDHYVTGGQVTHIFVLDLESREVTDLMPGSERLLPFWGAAGSWDIAPDGEEIAFSANSTEPPYRQLNFDIYVMTASGSDVRNLTADNPAFDTRPRYSPDRRYIVYGRRRRPEVAPDFTRLAGYDRTDGTVAGLAQGWDHQPRGWTFAADGDELLFHANERGRVHLYRLEVGSGEPEPLVGGGSTSGVAAGPGARVVYAEQAWNRPPELYAARIGRGGAARDVRALTAFNAERLAGLDLGDMESVTFEGAGGDEVQMFVLHPPGFDPGRRWPLLHLVHGGPHGSWTDSFHFRWNMALFASRGYVVAAVNFHGSTGRGQLFAESILGNHAEKPFQDLMAATDLLLERGYIDASRMAAAGGSYGGYMVSWIMGHTDRFAAIVNHAGVYDLMAQFASDYTWSRPRNYGAAPWQDPARIDLYSPSRFAANFTTPTLILHGEKDYRVPYTQALNLHQVLTGKGVPSRLVIYPGENHWVLKPQAARLWWDEVFGWLERYIGAPADSGPNGG